MGYTPNIPQLQQSNSTTYSDELGLLLGLERLPAEKASTYVRRLAAATQLRRDHPYEGSVNEINIQLGFIPEPYISLNLSPGTIVSASIAGVVVSGSPSTYPSVPLLTFDKDSMWKWRMLSDVVNDLNNILPSVEIATLLVEDGPAFQIARQTNSLWSFSEPVIGVQVQLNNNGIVVGSELFNNVVSSYILSTSGLLTFTSEPPAGTAITYNYVVTPYSLVGSPVSLIGLKDPEFPSVAETDQNILAYQVQEFTQTIMLQDRSYWTK